MIRVQPNEGMYLRVLNKAPGIVASLVESDLDLSYHERYGYKTSELLLFETFFSFSSFNSTISATFFVTFVHFERFEGPIPDAYHRLLYEALNGDQRNFVREDELDVC